MGRLLRTLAFLLAAVTIPAGSAVAYDVWQDRQHRVAILGHARLYHDVDSDSIVTTLSPSESVEVRRVRYSKDYIYVRVRTAKGTEGYLLYGDSTWRFVR